MPNLNCYFQLSWPVLQWSFINFLIPTKFNFGVSSKWEESYSTVQVISYLIFPSRICIKILIYQGIHHRAKFHSVVKSMLPPPSMCFIGWNIRIVIGTKYLVCFPFHVILLVSYRHSQRFLAKSRAPGCNKVNSIDYAILDSITHGPLKADFIKYK